MSAAVEVVDTEEDSNPPVPVPVPKSKKKRPPAKHEELPKPEEAQQVSPYPKGVAVWTYQPKDEKAAPILLPLNGIPAGDKLWYFDLAQLPILAQTWRWMDRAKVPKPIQRQAQLLDDAEYFAMFNQWFDVLKAGQAPKGSVTAGK